MPREKELFRVNLDRLDKAFPNSELLSYKQIEAYLGISHSTAFRRFGKLRKRGGFSKCEIARELAD
ncbi:MAG: hypothetical protein PUE69_00770 [Ruminococcus sp.]|nr:hypothetical protein [Ruminococcus sp.]